MADRFTVEHTPNGAWPYHVRDNQQDFRVVHCNTRDYAEAAARERNERESDGGKSPWALDAQVSA